MIQLSSCYYSDLGTYISNPGLIFCQNPGLILFICPYSGMVLDGMCSAFGLLCYERASYLCRELLTHRETVCLRCLLVRI